jgi:two-component system sensor histidine kinase YesM
MTIQHKRVYFTKTTITFLSPLILSLMILGSFAVKNSQAYVVGNVHKVNENILSQTRDTIDTMMDELSIITLNFSVNTRFKNSLRRILQKDSFSYEDSREIGLIQSMINIPHYSRAYIQSIYVYFNNPSGHFIATDWGVTSLKNAPDKEWYQSYLSVPAGKMDWLERRTIQRIGISKNTVEVLTFYKRIYDISFRVYSGVVVFNVYVDHIQNLLNNLNTFKNQTIFIIDEYNNIIAVSSSGNDFLLPRILDLASDVSEFCWDKNTYTAAQNVSKYNLKCISVVPNSTLYELPDYLFRMYISYIAVALLAGISLSMYFAHNENKQIRTILAIINSAKEGKFHPPERYTRVIKNSFQYILYNIINTFIEKDYLTMQLSERKYKGRLDELIALQSQINPHFLFNTLQTINMKAMSLGNVQNDISYIIEHLSSILRYSLTDPSGLVRFEEEISNAKSYLAIQSIRYKNKIHVTWKYEESILKFGIIKLLFQPLVENSIYHGIKEQEEPGEILVVVEEEDELLNITIADTGAGIPEDVLKDIRRRLEMQDDQFEHIGLYNTNRRIKLTFGDAYGISIESEADYGTIVQVKVPKIQL